MHIGIRGNFIVRRFEQRSNDWTVEYERSAYGHIEARKGSVFATSEKGLFMIGGGNQDPYWSMVVWEGQAAMKRARLYLPDTSSNQHTSNSTCSTGNAWIGVRRLGVLFAFLPWGGSSNIGIRDRLAYSDRKIIFGFFQTCFKARSSRSGMLRRRTPRLLHSQGESCAETKKAFQTRTRWSLLSKLRKGEIRNFFTGQSKRK